MGFKEETILFAGGLHNVGEAKEYIHRNNLTKDDVVLLRSDDEVLVRVISENVELKGT